MISEKSDSGWVMVFVALSLVVLCGFIALAVDVGSFVSARTSAQRAADAAALAGALTYVTGGDATTQAVQIATSNQIMGAAIQPGEVTVTFPASRQVQVVISRNAPTYFAKVLGMNIATIGATAIAEAASSFNTSDCVKPLFLPNAIHADFPCNACASSMVIIDGSGQVTSLGASLLLPPPSAPSYYNIHVRSATESLNAPLGGEQNVFATTFGNDTQSGITQFGQNILECPAGARISCLNSFPVKNDSGLNSVAQTEFTNLVNANGTPDIFSGLGKYKGPDGNFYNTSHQLITVPIFDVCSIPSFCNDANNDGIGDAILTNPARQITVVGFARMFATISYTGKVRLYLVGLDGCGTVPPPSPDPGPYGYPVRLVHN
jgi:hypothetical protein